MADKIFCENKATKIWDEYQKSKEYQDSMGFRTQFPEIIRFKEGNQWPAPTTKTKNFPRPVFNITEMFIRNKRAAVTNQALEISYVPLEVADDDKEKENAEMGAKAYTDYSKIVWENIDQDELNNEFLDDAITLGTGFLHYYWDNEIYGGRKLKYFGDLAGEVIDVLNVGVENPQIRNIQKQKWIIIESQKTIEDVKKLAEENGISPIQLELIKPDGGKNYYDNDSKANDDDKVTILTKYFKKDGVVFYSKSTRDLMIVNERMLTPEPDKIETENQDFESSIESKNINSENDIERPKITLYPIVCLVYKKRKKCIYGIGEAADIITINKLYNQLKGMMALNVIRTGNPNILTKRNAIKQQLTNEGGQQIIDYFDGNGDGIKYMQPPNFPNEFSKIASEIFDMARTLTGNTDVSTGEVIGANMAASAIIALQNQARTPIKEIQTRFFSAMKEVGDIWCQFYKTFYSTTRKMSVEENGKIETRNFRGTDYANTDFKTKVEVTVSSDKESLSMSVLENMKTAGDINKQQYVELAPDSAIPFKSKLKKMWEQEEQQKQLLAQAMEQIKQYQEIFNKQNSINGGMLSEMQTMSNGNAN